MNELKKIVAELSAGSKVEQLRYALFLLLIVSLPFDILYSAVLIITFLASVLVDVNLSKIKTIPGQFWKFQLIYFLGLAGYIYSFNKTEAAFLLERQLSILLLPLFVPLAFEVTKARITAAMGALTIATVLAILYLFVIHLQLIHSELKLPLLPTLFSGAFFNHEFSRPLKIHAGYLSLYVSLSIAFTVFIFNRGANNKFKIALIIVLGILFMGLFFLASRNILIATFIILLFLYPVFHVKNLPKYVVIVILVLLGSFVIIRSVPYLWDRFAREMFVDLKSAQQSGADVYYTAEPRVDRWKAGLHLVKQSPLIGYGTGDEKLMLKSEYMKRQLYISYLESFNSHNQYLSYLLKNGILGLIIFLGAFYYYLKQAIKIQSFVYLAFLVLLLIGFYTENILDANKGILFFAIFNTLFGYYAINKIKADEAAFEAQV